ncbi:MAG: hypothetical protein RI973_2175 [Bacteroidota bacterium]|jgi:LPS export ABC transporter protein LptC
MKGHACFLCFLLLGLLLASCENDINEVNRLFSKDETMVETAVGVELLYSDSARLRLRIAAPKLVRHLDQQEYFQEFPEGLVVEFYSENGRDVSSRLRAGYAQRFENSSKFIVRDSVVWSSRQGERLESEELIWEEEADKVHTRKFVIMRRPGEIVYGHGFESNQAFTQWRIRAIEGKIRSGDWLEDLQR